MSSPTALLTRLFLLGLCTVATVLAQDLPTLQTVIGNTRLWPREVTLAAPIEVPIIIAGKASGSMSVPAGRVLPVKAVKPTGIEVDAMGTDVVVSADQTDFLARARAIDAQLKPTPTPTPASLTDTAIAKVISWLPSAPVTTNKVAQSLDHDLVALDGRKLKKFDAAQLTSKKYLAVYFSAHWCPPCRAFTPELVAWYNETKKQFPNFDIIFYSRDQTADDMLNYMRDDNMPWPAVDFKKTKLRNDLEKYAGPGIPDLVVLDQDGKVVADSYEGTHYVGPQKVTRDLLKLLQGS